MMNTDKPTLNLNNERTVSQMVGETLRRAIIKGELKLGERLVEATIAKQLKVSITPVRHAFSQLAAEGLIQIYPFKGTYVISITREWIDEIYLVRPMIETAAAKLSIAHITEQDCIDLEQLALQMGVLTEQNLHDEFAVADTKFHRFFYEKSGNRLLLEMWGLIQFRVQLLQSYGRLYGGKTLREDVIASHQIIIDAVRSRNTNYLELAIHKHIEHGRELIEQSEIMMQGDS